MSKRIESNKNIYKQISALELEYFGKIYEVLTQMQSNSELPEIEKNIIVGTKWCINLETESINLRSYSDKSDRNYTTRLKTIKNIIGGLETFKEVESLYDEGMVKINELSVQFQEPKRMVTFENFENDEEYSKLYKYNVDEYIKNGNKDVFNRTIDMLYKRADLIGLKVHKVKNPL